MSKIVTFNIPIKVRFTDGYQLTITIIDDDITRFPQKSSQLIVSKNSPIAKAILGKKQGDTGKYIVVGRNYVVTIVDIL